MFLAILQQDTIVTVQHGIGRSKSFSVEIATARNYNYLQKLPPLAFLSPCQGKLVRHLSTIYRKKNNESCTLKIIFPKLS